MAIAACHTASVDEAAFGTVITMPGDNHPDTAAERVDFDVDVYALLDGRLLDLKPRRLVSIDPNRLAS
jgi:hypothetical protein